MKYGGRTVYDLDVFKLSYDLSLALHKLSLTFPDIERYRGMGDQIRRSSKSICANLVEGLSKEASAAEERRFVLMALGSAREVELWLKYAKDLGYVPVEEAQRYTEEAGRVCRMLLGLQKMKSVK